MGPRAVGVSGLPSALAEQPSDPSYGVPVPFVCGRDNGPYGVGTLNRRRVIQCALSRICAMCGRSLENPLVLVGSTEEVARNAFRVPPMHADCADAVLAVYAPLPGTVLDHPPGNRAWVRVVTGGFDLERPSERGGRTTFRPNSVMQSGC